MVRTKLAVFVLIIGLLTGCISGPTGNGTNLNNTTPTEGTETNDSVSGEVVAALFVETDRVPANYSTVLEYDELDENEKELFNAGVRSDGTVRVNDTTREFVSFLRELSQPVEDAEGIGGERVDPEVDVERNGTRYRVELVHGNSSR